MSGVDRSQKCNDFRKGNLNLVKDLVETVVLIVRYSMTRFFDTSIGTRLGFSM